MRAINDEYASMAEETSREYHQEQAKNSLIERIEGMRKQLMLGGGVLALGNRVYNQALDDVLKIVREV